MLRRPKPGAAGRPAWLVAFGVVCAAAACGDATGDPPCPQGTEGCDCYDNGSCDEGLECRSDRCGQRESIAPTGGRSNPGTGGKGSAATGGVVTTAGSAGSHAGGTTQPTGGASAGGAAMGTGGTLTLQGGAPNGGDTAGGVSGGGQNAVGGASTGGVGGASTTGGAQAKGGASSGGASSGGASSAGETSEGGSAGSAEPVVLPFFDDFEDGDTADWTAPSFEVVEDDDGNHVLRAPTLTSNLEAHIGDETWTDVRIELRLKFATIETEDARMQIMGRVNGSMANHAFYLYVGAEAGSYGGLIEMTTSGGEVMLFGEGFDVAEQLVADRWYTLVLLIEGDTSTAYLDGVEVMSITGTVTESGDVALTASSATDGIVYFDDISITEP